VRRRKERRRKRKGNKNKRGKKEKEQKEDGARTIVSGCRDGGPVNACETPDGVQCKSLSQHRNVSYGYIDFIRLTE
jgi:hypothetical protein